MVNFTVYKGSKDGKIVKGTTSKEVGHDEVIVCVQLSGLCGTNIHCKSVDTALGYEGTDVVEQLRRDVKTLQM